MVPTLFFTIITESPGSVGLPERSIAYSSGERTPPSSAPPSVRSQYVNSCDPYASPPGNSSYPLNHSPTLPVSQQNMMPSIPFSDAGMPVGLLSPASQGLSEAMRVMVSSGPPPSDMNTGPHSAASYDDFTPGAQHSWPIEQPQYWWTFTGIWCWWCTIFRTWNEWNLFLLLSRLTRDLDGNAAVLTLKDMVTTKNLLSCTELIWTIQSLSNLLT